MRHNVSSQKLFEIVILLKYTLLYCSFIFFNHNMNIDFKKAFMYEVDSVPKLSLAAG